MIIALSGKSGSGKDYLAKYYFSKYLNNPIILAFADHLKVEVFYKYSLKKNQEFCKEKIRELLQYEGTEMGRKKDSNIWIKKLDSWIALFQEKGYKNFIITDVRFKNEAEYINNLESSILIRIKAPQRNEEKKQKKEIKNHISENDLNNYPFKYTINNDYGSNPEEQIKEILIKEKII